MVCRRTDGSCSGAAKKGHGLSRKKEKCHHRKKMKARLFWAKTSGTRRVSDFHRSCEPAISQTYSTVLNSPIYCPVCFPLVSDKPRLRQFRYRALLLHFGAPLDLLQYVSFPLLAFLKPCLLHGIMVRDQ